MNASASTLAARFARMQDARIAIEALEHHGIDGSDIVLAGRVAHEAAEPGDEAVADHRAVRHLSRRVARGLVIGVMLGGVAGLGMGLLVTSDSAAAIVALLFFGVLLGAVVGMFLSSERHVGRSEAWELTFHEPGSGSVWVAVKAVEPDTVDRAAKVLSALEPLEVRHR